MLPNTQAPSERAFTLLELLIVILIIAVLTALVIPVTNAISHTQRSARCSNNLRQIGVTLFAYAADNGNKIPPRFLSYDRSPRLPGSLASWPSRLLNLGYTQKPEIFFCPSAPPYSYLKDVEAGRNIYTGGGLRTYGIRTWGPPGQSYLKYREEEKPLSAIEEPANFFIVADSYWTAYEGQGYGIVPGVPGQAAHARHKGLANALFADGHVEGKPPEYFTSLHETDNQSQYQNGTDTRPGNAIHCIVDP